MLFMMYQNMDLDANKSTQYKNFPDSYPASNLGIKYYPGIPGCLASYKQVLRVLRPQKYENDKLHGVI